ncbi:hypothetical protein IQ06DRAFT_208888 [Phaeosphaeriaceae sp. SRC1lsM3a]|nr:hypothetical protein IQ06DRAFT_208888 [Stagonospora sp. SRC1lsM3a]
MTDKRPFIVIIPGASQNPAHYGYLSHLLLQAGYPVLTALLPTLAATGPVTIDDDASYIRDRMLLPVLDYEERDVVLLMHSYGSVPGSASAHGLGPSSRLAQGKKTAVLGQIFFATMLVRGGDGKTTVDVFGGAYPSHIEPDHERNLLHAPLPLRIPTIYPDVPSALAESAASSVIPQGMHAFHTPIPKTSWANEEYKGRVACIRTTKDQAIPIEAQQEMLEESGVEWIVRDVESGHSPQMSAAEELVGIVGEVVGILGGMR